MSKKNLPPIYKKGSVLFDIDNNEVLISDPLPPIIDKLEINEKRFGIFHVAVQTDPQWLEEIKRDLLSTLQTELNGQDGLSNLVKSKPSTVITKKSKLGSTKSKIKSDLSIQEDNEAYSERSEDSQTSIPAYPEMQVTDEFGISLYSSSDDDENFNPEKISDVIGNINEFNYKAEVKTEIQTNDLNIIPDAGLPNFLKVSKELVNTDISLPVSADTFIMNAFSPKEGEMCEFCQKPLVAMPTVKDQVSSSVDQAKLFCCQEYRELVDFALAQKSNNITLNGTKQPEIKLIDISPHKSTKNLAELVQSKENSEKRLRERLLARQQAALMAAQYAKTAVDGPRRAHTDFINISSRQIKMINYQLSSYKFVEDGWTVSPVVLSNIEMAANKEISEDFIDMDYTKSIYDLFGQSKFSEESFSFGVIREYYPDGKLFLVLFPDGSANIYYPSGNLAILMVGPSVDSSAICMVKEDSPSIDSQCKILAVINTSGFGSFSFSNESQRIVFNSLFGVELNRDGTKKRQWFWSGEPHIHGPPFQSICFSINKHIGVRLSSKNSLYINFFGNTKQIHVNVGSKSEIPMKIRQKMHTMVKIENDRLERPLMELRVKTKDLIEKCNEALNHPSLLMKNKWPAKSNHFAKTTSENRKTLSFSMV